MNSSQQKVAVIIGVGPENGMGAALCRRFANNDYHVFVGGRTFEKVETVASNINANGGKATPVACDATEIDTLDNLFAQAADAGQITLAIYNAGNNMPGDFLTMEPEFFEKCWRIACYGGFLFSQLALKHMAPNEEGTLLFTGASASMRGKPFFSAFTAAKAGLRALAQSLAREFGPKGVHVAHVVIDGAIDGDRINKGRPEVAEALGKEGLVDIEGIVDVYEMLDKQPSRAWTHEIDVRTATENF
ncbi:SDR family NAD(P)-dependent oxidoreductase [Maricurvus nonylphenolicus]|uniref:SDR family NAD(P)-dependent oxidoreductase n=1 Tax=Maricurvus nonylphenolicus TaxID=1008307 RepID=UPI0036F34B48